MPNAAAASQHPDQDRELSVDESWSSDNGNRGTQNGSNGSRVPKRKRPLTVSYVIFAASTMREQN